MYKEETVATLSRDEMISWQEQFGYVAGEVEVELGVLFAGFENFLNEISLRLTGSDLLMDIRYTPISVIDEDIIVFRVSGDASAILEAEVL